MSASVTDPLAVFAILSGACAAIFLIASWKPLARVFEIVPAAVLVVFLPALLSGVGILPRQSATYDALRDFGLPLGLFLMVVTTDVRSVLRLGPRAIGMFLFGSLGVVVGAVVVYVVAHPTLPPDSWKMFAAISASWTGGGANFAAVQAALDMPATLVGPAIVVDATVTYLWLAVTLAAATYQHVVTRFYRPRDPLSEDAVTDSAEESAPLPARIDFPDLLVVLGVGLCAAALGMGLAETAWERLAPANDATLGLGAMLNAYLLGIVVVTLLGALLSMTPVRQLDARGATPVGAAAQFLFFASLGAQADFAALLSMPVMMLAGVAWIAFHALFMALGAWVLRAPMSLIAVASSANVGGSSTAAVIGAQYGRAWSSLGVLLGLFGNLIGTFVGLACGALLALLTRG